MMAFETYREGRRMSYSRRFRAQIDALLRLAKRLTGQQEVKFGMKLYNWTWIASIYIGSFLDETLTGTAFFSGHSIYSPEHAMDNLQKQILEYRKKVENKTKPRNVKWPAKKRKVKK